MGIRTVRLDDATEATLARLRKTTGLSITEVVKRGLKTYERVAPQEGTPTPWEIRRTVKDAPAPLARWRITRPSNA